MENAHLSRVDARKSEAAKILKSVDASLSLKAQAIIIESRIDFSSFSYLSGCSSFIIRKPDAQHADENDNWLRILYNLTVCEDARSFKRIDHRTAVFTLEVSYLCDLKVIFKR